MTFVKGESGNPAGRPIGSRNRKTLIVEGLLEGDAERLTRRAIDLALGGDPTALKLCLERIYPRGRDRPVAFPLPPIEKAADLMVAANWIGSGIGTGEISPSEALALLRVVDWSAKFLRLAQAEKKLQQMESQVHDLTARLAAAENTSGKQAGQPNPRHDAAAKNTSENQNTSSEQAEQPAPCPAPAAGPAKNTSAEQQRPPSSGRPPAPDARCPIADGLAERRRWDLLPDAAPNTSGLQAPIGQSPIRVRPSPPEPSAGTNPWELRALDRVRYNVDPRTLPPYPAGDTYG